MLILYLLNHQTLCNQTWCTGASSAVGELCGKCQGQIVQSSSSKETVCPSLSHMFALLNLFFPTLAWWCIITWQVMVTVMCKFLRRKKSHVSCFNTAEAWLHLLSSMCYNAQSLLLIVLCPILPNQCSFRDTLDGKVLLVIYFLLQDLHASVCH